MFIQYEEERKEKLRKNVKLMQIKIQLHIYTNKSDSLFKNCKKKLPFFYKEIICRKRNRKYAKKCNKNIFIAKNFFFFFCKLH